VKTGEKLLILVKNDVVFLRPFVLRLLSPIVCKSEGMTQNKQYSKIRQSVSFSQEQHDALMELADINDVSFCWVVRYACNILIRESKKGSHLLELSLDRDENELLNDE